MLSSSAWQVGDGVKDLAEGDVVIPARPHFGTWRTLAVCKAQDVLKLPAGLLAMEHAALACHLCTAYRLLESCRGLQVSHHFCSIPACNALDTEKVPQLHLWKPRSAHMIWEA